MSVRVSEGIDAGLVWHSGEPARDQRELLAGKACVRLDNRGVVTISGPDRLTWLHSLTTQHLEQLADGVSVSALVLSPTGHIEHSFRGVDDGQVFWAITEPGRAGALVAWLSRMQFMRQVEVRDRSQEYRVVWLAGRALPVAGDLPSGAVLLDSEVSADGEPTVDVIVPRASAWPQLPDVGVWTFEAMRIAAGVPRIFVDTDQRTIPNEIALYGTHLDKGCYRGQETVARVYNLGRPPRRLTLLHLDGSQHGLPASGVPLTLDQREVGWLGSSARHHELGPIALALVKRNIPVDATLQADQIDAAQETLVDPDVGLHVRPLR